MKVAIITGGNGSVGAGIATRLVQESLDPIHVILACRTVSKGTEIANTIKLPETLRSQITVMKLDLSDPYSVISFCNDFKKSFTRLDYLYLNAGILPIAGTNLKQGVINLLTRPSYVSKTGGDILVQHLGQVTAFGHGAVFASNVLGHYMLVKLLENELASAAPSIISWCTSTTACREHFNNQDWQCLKGDHPYESSKRLCELISATIHGRLRVKGIYSVITSPGNVFSALSVAAVHPLVLMAVLHFMRFLGASGVNITGFNAATASYWLTTIDDYELLKATTIYHSEISPLGKTSVAFLDSDITENDIKDTKRIVACIDAIVCEFQ